MSDTEQMEDYLEVDTSIPGQNYCCISFLSPEKIMKNKAAFYITRFLKSYCKDKKIDIEDVEKDYLDFTYKHVDQLQKDYDESCDFKTNVRGVKVRGVYDSRREAESRAKKLHMSEPNFHVFIGQVGYWLPWDPDADRIQDEVYLNSQLNDMMGKYKENEVNKDMFYSDQKLDKMKSAKEDVAKAKKARELEAKMQPEPELLEPEPELVNDVPSASKVDDELKDSLEADDPWMQRKKDESQ
tara:strand:- start:448 stop:1170 length:723 start_codon:yes stop_codon:yes gene_type:complete